MKKFPSLLEALGLTFDFRKKRRRELGAYYYRHRSLILLAVIKIQELFRFFYDTRLNIQTRKSLKDEKGLRYRKMRGGFNNGIV